MTSTQGLDDDRESVSPEADGALIDDYVAFAQVFADINGNGTWDDDEPITTTDENGRFQLKGLPDTNVMLIGLGGVDTASGVPNTIVYRAYSNKSQAQEGRDLVLSPMTTLITAIAETLKTQSPETEVTQELLEQAAQVLNLSLGLNVSNPADLLNFDAVAAATRSDVTAQDLELLSINRQISAVVAATGALIDGADPVGSNLGTLKSSAAFASLLLDEQHNGSTLDLKAAVNIERIAQKTILLANEAGVTQDLRASSSEDLALLSQVISTFTTRIDEATKADDGPMSTNAIAAMVSVNDLMIPLLQNTGSEAVSERGGDISIAQSMQQLLSEIRAQATPTDFVAQKISLQKEFLVQRTDDFGSQQDVAGYINEYVPLGIQLPSLGVGDVVDSLTLDTSELAAQDAKVQLFRYDPLTKSYSEVTLGSDPAKVSVDPRHAGFLFVKTDGALVDKGLFGAEVEIPLAAKNTVGNQETNYQGQLIVTVRARPVQVTATITEVLDDVSGPAGPLPQGIPLNGLTNDSTPLIKGILDRPLPDQDNYRLFLYSGETLLGQAVVVGTTWQYQVVTPLSNALHSVTTRVVFDDVDGEKIAWASRPYSFTVDAIAPLAPTVDASAGSIITGSAEPGATVTITLSPNVLGTAVADTRGRWAFTPSTRIDDGASVTAFATDPAGNQGPSSVPAVVDWLAPSQTVTITTVIDDASPVTGNVASGGYTNDHQLQVSGTLSAALGPFESLEIYREGESDPLVGVATVNGTTWTFAGGIWSDGEYPLYARVVLKTDGQTKYGAKSAPYVVTIDTQAPAQAITVERAFDNFGLVQGKIGNSLNSAETAFIHTNDPTPTFNGQLTAPLAVGESLVAYSTVVSNGVPSTVRIGTATISTDNSGNINWVFTPINALADGAHTFTFQIEDRAGNASAISNKANYAFTIDTRSFDNPIVNSGAAVSPQENITDTIYTATVAGNREVQWRLSEDSDPGFVIDAKTGQVRLLAATDFESKTAYNFTVIAYDGQHAPSAKKVSVNLANVIEAQEILSVSTNTLRAVVAPPANETQELSFTIVRSHSDGEASVDWTLSGLPASDIAQLLQAGLPVEGTARFVTGESTAVVVVYVPASLTQESVRQAVLTLSKPSQGYAIDPDNSLAMVEIVDSNSVAADVLRFTVAATNNGVIEEGGAGTVTSITYTVTRNQDDSTPIGFELSPSGAALISGGDFQDTNGQQLTNLPSGALTFTNNQASITIYVRGDNAVGPDERFNFVLTNLPEGARVIGNTGGAVLNDDAYITVAARQVEGDPSGELTHAFVITRSGNTDVEHTVNYTVAGVGENSTSLFDAQTPTQLTFRKGETEKVVLFRTNGSEIINGFQSFGIQLTAGPNVTLLNSAAVSTLDPNVQDISMLAEIDRALEGGAAEFIYKIIRSGDLSKPLEISWAVEADDERGVSANDFAGLALPSGIARFKAGESETRIRFSSAQDSLLDGDEGFRLILDDTNLAEYVRLITPSIEGVIVDDEAAVGFAINAQFSVVEGDKGGSDLVVTVSRVGFTGRESTVDWSLGFVSGQGKASLADLLQGQPLSGTVRFLPGEASAAITIRVAGDVDYEGGLHETLTVTLANPSEGTQLIGADGVTFAGYDKAATATITNDDALISVLTPVMSGTEANAGADGFIEITVVRTGSLVGEDTVKWSLKSSTTGVSADNTDIGVENSAVGVLNQYKNSWIDLATFNGSQRASGTVEITKSGYIMVAYNRDWEFDDDDDGNVPFDQFLLKNLSVSNGATLTSLGNLTNKTFIAGDASVTGYGQTLFDNATGVSLPNAEQGGRQVVISSKDTLGSVYFKVTGLNADGESVSEVIKGSNGGAVSTAAYFTKVNKVETVAPGFSVGELDVPSDDYDYYDTDYFRQLKLTWENGDLPGVRSETADEYRAGSSKRGAEYESDMGYPALRSEADLSDTVFIIKGGLVVAYFDTTYSYSSNGSSYTNRHYDFKEGDGIYGQDAVLRFDTPQKIRAEQVSGIFQSTDESDAPNYFVVTGINAAGSKVIETIVVEDFDANGLVELNSYNSGNMLSQAVRSETPGRVMISTNGEDQVPRTVILTEEMLREAAGFSESQSVYYFYLQNIPAGKVERFDGTNWNSIEGWSFYNTPDGDLAQGRLRVTGGLSGSSVQLEIADTNWNYVYPKLEVISPIAFTVTGIDSNGQQISEVVSAPDFGFAVYNNGQSREGDKATVASTKHFQTVTSVTASQSFEGNIQIGLSKPVETINEFVEVLGVAAVNAEGAPIDPNEIDFGGRIEFVVPLEVTLKGPNAGVVISPQVMNYIESIEIQRSLPASLKVDIGYGQMIEPVILSFDDILEITQTEYQADDIYRVRIYSYDGSVEYNSGTAEEPVWEVLDGSESFYRGEDTFENMIRLLDPSKQIERIRLYSDSQDNSTSYYDLSVGAGSSGSMNFNVLQNQNGAITAEISNNFKFNTNTVWDSGNPRLDTDPNMGYAIFRIEAPFASVESPVRLSFDIEQLGRYGIDTGRFAYAPDGTFSTDIYDLLSDDQNLLIEPLVAQDEIRLLSLEFFARGVNGSDLLSIDAETITQVYIDNSEVAGSFLYRTNDGWVDFWRYIDREGLDPVITAEEIEAGRLGYTGAWIELDFEVTHEGGEDYASSVAVIQRIELSQLLSDSRFVESEVESVNFDDVSNAALYFNVGDTLSPRWVNLWDYLDNQESSSIPRQAILDGRIGVAAYGDGTFYIEAYVNHANGEDYIEVDLSPLTEPALVVESAGAVQIEGDGYIWVRYANMFHSNEGADRAWIKSLYVDNGATLKVVGQKAVSDGIANSQQVSNGKAIKLDGVAVDYVMPDHSSIEGDLMLYISSTQIEKFDGLDYYYVGKNSDGLLVEDDRYASSFFGTERPNDGMYRFLPMRDIGVENFERFTWEEETSSTQMWEPQFGLVKGSLSNLAERVSLSSRGEYAFAVDYSADEFYPGASINIGEDFYVSVEDMLPEFARAILAPRELSGTEELFEVNFAGQAAIRVTITSDDDLSGRSITINGTGANGEEISETLFGPNAGTAATNAKFLTITSVGVSEGSGQGTLNVGYAKAFDSPRELGAFSYDGMPSAVFTILGLDADGNRKTFTLNGTETGVTHPIGQFSEVWSISNNGRASENLEIFFLNAPQTLFNIGSFGSSTLNVVQQELGVSEGYQFFNLWSSYSNYNLSQQVPLVFQASPELAGRTLRFYGSSPQDDYNSQWYTYTIPESGVLITDIPFDYAYYFEVQSGSGVGAVTVSWSAPVGNNSDLQLRSSTDFSGTLVVKGVDEQGRFKSETISSLDSETTVNLSGFSALISYEYSGEGVAPEISLQSVPNYGFYQEIPLAGNRDGQGLIELPGERKVVITVYNSDAENQIIKVTGLVDGVLVTETLYGIADGGISAITKQMFTHLQKIEVGADNYNSSQRFSVGTITPVIDEQTVSRYGGDMKLGEAVAVLESESKVTLTSQENLSGTNFLISGFDASGKAISETVAGPNAATVMSTLSYLKVTSIEVSGSAQGNVKVGYVTQAGAMIDDFAIAGQGTQANPFMGHSTNTLEAYLAQNGGLKGAYSEADILFYVDTSRASGTVRLHYDLAMQGSSAAGESTPADRLFIEYSGKEIPLLSGEVTFKDGESTTIIKVPVAGDDTREPDEKISLTLTGSSPGATIVKEERTAEITILNDDDAIWLGASAASGKEGNAQDGKVSFTVHRQDGGPAKTVRWEIILDGTTTAQEEDFAALSGEVTFSEGQTTANLEVVLARDNLLEADETFKVRLSTPEPGSGYSINGNDSASGTIINDDSAITITAMNPGAVEGNSGTIVRTYTITRTGDLSAGARLLWGITGDTLDGSALGVTGSDFAGGVLPSAQTLVFLSDPNSSSQSSQAQQISITTSTNTFATGDRGYSLTLANDAGDSTDLRQASVVDVIREDDPLSITVTPPSDRTEGDSGEKGFIYTLRRNDDISKPLTVNWKVLLQGTVPLASLSDFAQGQDALGLNQGLPSGAAEFAAGVATATVTVRVKGDTIVEPSEAFTLGLMPAYSDTAGAQYETKIIGDDIGYSVLIDRLQVAEGNVDSVLKVNFVRAGDSTSAATLSYDIRGNTSEGVDPATDGDFVTPMTGELLFEAGQEQVTLDLKVKGDSVFEGTDGFLIDFKAQDLVLATSDPVIILNDDTRVIVTRDRAEIQEASSGPGETITYTFIREAQGKNDQESRVKWFVSGKGITAEDFVGAQDSLGEYGGLPSGTVVFAPGETEKTVTLTVAPDSLHEPDETFEVNFLTASAGTEVATNVLVTKILDDDAEFYLSVAAENQAIVEGNGGGLRELSYTAYRRGNEQQLNQMSDVTWSISGDTQNFAPNPGITGRLRFMPGETEKTFTVNLRQDNSVEPNGSFTVTLSSPSTGNSVSPATGENGVTVSVADDDIGLRLASGSPAQIIKAEGLEGAVTEYVWEIERIGRLDAVSFTYNLIPAYGSGYGWTDSSDFVDSQTTGTLSFAQGQTLATLKVQVKGDAVVENSEAFRVSFQAGIPNDITLSATDIDLSLTGVLARDESLLKISQEIDAATLEQANLLASGSPPTLGQSSAKAEGDTGFVSHFFKVYREFTTAGDVSVDWRVSGQSQLKTDISPYLSHVSVQEASVDDFETADGLGTNGGFPSGRITIPDGQAFVILEIKTRADLTPEDLEGFRVTISNPDAGNTIDPDTNTSLAYIRNDDASFSVGLLDPDTDQPTEMGSKVIQEGQGTVTYRVYRNGDTAHAAAVDWALSYPDPVKGSGAVNAYQASAGDFDATTNPLSGTLNFAAGEAYRDITLKIQNDAVVESWAEFFTVGLSNPRYTDGFSGKPIGVSALAGSMESIIIDNDANADPQVTNRGSFVSVTSSVNNEGFEGTPGGQFQNTAITYTFTRTGDLTTQGQIAWVLEVPASAQVADVVSITGDTYEVQSNNFYYSGMLSFAVGESVKTVTVSLIADQVVESAQETFTLTLVDAASILAAKGEGIYDPIQNSNYGGIAQDNQGIFLADLTWDVPDSGSLYRHPTAFSLETAIKNDDTRLRVTDVLFGSSTPFLFVRENDSGAQDITFNLARDGRTDNQLTISYELLTKQGDTATEGEGDGKDYLRKTGTFTLAAGQTNYQLTIDDVIAGDLTVEPNEVFTLRLTSSTADVYFNQSTFFDGTMSGASSQDVSVQIVTDDTTWSVGNSIALGAPQVSVEEGDSGLKQFAFVIARPNQGDHYSGPATVNWALRFSGFEKSNSGNSFASAEDFQAVAGQVSFAANEFSKTVSVSLVGDRLAEFTEEFGFAITSVSHGVIDQEKNLATARIINNDTVISVADVQVREGDEGTSILDFVVTRTGDLERQSTVSYNLLHVTTNDQDIDLPASGQIVFASGINNLGEKYGTETQIISVVVKGDLIPEDHETLKVRLSGVSTGSQLGQAEAVGTILNDEATFTLSAGQLVNEGDTLGQRFTVTRSHATAQEQVIDWSVSSAGSGLRAAAGNDFESGFPNGPVAFEAGSNDLTKTFFVQSRQDSDVELNEIYKVTIAAKQGLAAGSSLTRDIAYGVIQNDDTASEYTGASDSRVSIAGPAQVVEGDAGIQYVVFTLSRTFDDAPYDGEIAWSLSFSGQSADASDFDAVSGRLLLPAGVESTELRIPVKADSLAEPDETFMVTIISQTPGMAIGTATEVGTIVNDDSLIQILDNISLSEDAGVATFTLSRSGSSTSAKTVAWALTPGVNVSGSEDITSTLSGTATFAAGATETTVRFNLRNDNISEADEVFNFTLSNPAIGASLDPSHSSKQLTILNDDRDRITYVADAVSKPEGDGVTEGAGWTEYKITVSRENPTQQLIAGWVVEDISPETLAGIEFEETSGQVVFELGSLESTFVVRVRSDDIGDFNKLFNLKLVPVDPVKAFVDSDDSKIQVINDDPAFSIAVSADRFTEGSGSNNRLVTFNITRSGDLKGDATIRWSLAADDQSDRPVNLSDFGGYWPTGIAAFADGDSVKTIQVAISPDSTFEADEGFKVVLSDLQAVDPGARITAGQARAVITNDDIGVRISVNQSVFTEGDAGETPVSFMIQAQGVSNRLVKVNFVLEGSGRSPADSLDFEFNDFEGNYQDSYFDPSTNAGWVRLRTDSNGQAGITVAVNILGDETAGANETFRLRVTTVEGGTIDLGVAEVTIVNDDVAITSIVNTAVEMAEGDTGSKEVTFLLTRSGDVSGAATVEYSVEGFGDNPADSDDFVSGLPSGTAIFEAGSATATIKLLIASDSLFESDEGLVLIVGKDTANEVRLATEIRNDDLATLEFRGLVTTVFEGSTDSNGVLSYEILRNGDNSKPLTVTYAIEGAAIADFSPSLGLVESGGKLVGTLQVPAGDSRAVLNLPVAADTAPAADRQFTVSISAVGFESPTALSGSVLDDDGGISIELVGSRTQQESDSTSFTFRINRVGNDLSATTLAWAVAGIGLNPVSSADFVNALMSSEVAFTGEDASASSKTFTISVLNDNLVENTEAFRVTLSYPDSETNKALQIRIPSVDAFITDNDPLTSSADVVQTGAAADVIHALGGDDTIRVGGGADLVYSGDGNDTVYGEGGADIVYGGLGDDKIIFNADNLTKFVDTEQSNARSYVDGGLGIDTLVFDGGNMEFDFPEAVRAGAIRGIEKLDITGIGNNIVSLSFDALESVSLSKGVPRTLVVDGDEGDEVVLIDFPDWERKLDHDGYAVWRHTDGFSEILISLAVTQPYERPTLDL